MVSSSDTPLVFWSETEIRFYEIRRQLFEYIQYIYLALFGISLVCMKLSGVETMYLVQFVFYSMIPIGVSKSNTFMGFASMKHVSGWNTLFQSLTQYKVLSNYSLLSLSSNFLSNVNLMLMSPLIFVFLAGICYLLSKATKDYKLQPRLLKLTKACLLEFPLALILFSTFNIGVSFVLNAQN